MGRFSRQTQYDHFATPPYLNYTLFGNNLSSGKRKISRICKKHIAKEQDVAVLDMGVLDWRFDLCNWTRILYAL